MADNSTKLSYLLPARNTLSHLQIYSLQEHAQDEREIGEFCSWLVRVAKTTQGALCSSSIVLVSGS